MTQTVNQIHSEQSPGKGSLRSVRLTLDTLGNGCPPPAALSSGNSGAAFETDYFRESMSRRGRGEHLKQTLPSTERTWGSLP